MSKIGKINSTHWKKDFSIESKKSSAKLVLEIAGHDKEKTLCKGKLEVLQYPELEWKY